MKKFSDLAKINEMKYGQPMYGENDFKVHMKNLLVREKNYRSALDVISPTLNFIDLMLMT